MVHHAPQSTQRKHNTTVAGRFKRLAAGLPAFVLSGAILQNLVALSDPQLAVLYTITVITLVFIEGGEYSVDEEVSEKPSQ